jgi:hypothetical protein
MGLVLLTLTVFFLLDAGGVWDLDPALSISLAAGGLTLAAAAGIVTQAARSVRGRRARRQV